MELPNITLNKYFESIDNKKKMITEQNSTEKWPLKRLGISDNYACTLWNTLPQMAFNQAIAMVGFEKLHPNCQICFQLLSQYS